MPRSPVLSLPLGLVTFGLLGFTPSYGAPHAAPATSQQIGAAIGAGARGGAVVSTFDADDDAWTVVGDAQGGSAIPDYLATGGNPGGYVSADDNVAGGVWYWSAPGPFLGDRAGSYARTLSFDLRQSATDSPFNAADVVLLGAGMQLDFDTAENPGTDWTPYTVPLDAGAGWVVVGTGAAPTEAEFLAVLADLTALRIRGEYRSGADTGGLDNVVLETEPATDAEGAPPASPFALSAPTPNPVRDATRLTLTRSAATGPSGGVRARVYDVLGREVLRLHDGPLGGAGPHTFVIDASALPAGLYVVVVEGDGGRATRRFTRLR